MKADDLLFARRALSYSLGHNYTDECLMAMNREQFKKAMTDNRDVNKMRGKMELHEENFILRNSLLKVLI